jgi:hypothetical protein
MQKYNYVLIFSKYSIEENKKYIFIDLVLHLRKLI